MSFERRKTLAAGVAIVLLVLAAYVPALTGGFIWDDDAYVTHNPLIRERAPLSMIWFSNHLPSQYQPLIYTAFQGEYALWGLNPLGYHLVNVLLHAANALLVWSILRYLAVPGATLAAAIFALHPVNVESVAWITELKNVLSTFWYLLTAAAWLRWHDGRRPGPLWYATALLLYLPALFSKSTTGTLAPALLALVWFRDGRVGRRALLGAAPLAVLGVCMGLLTVWWENVELGISSAGLAYTPAEKMLIAGRALWFYLGKLVWPVNLTFSYPRWTIEAGSPVAWLWPAAALATALLLWRYRGVLGRGPFAAAAFFAVTLAPLLGFFSLYTFKYTFVADHYQYVAMIGPSALLAAFVTRRTGKSARWAGIARLAIPVAMLSCLAVLTWRQASVYRSEETVWRDTIAKNPASWMARTNLGLYLLEAGRPREAVEQYRVLLGMRGVDADTHLVFGNALLQSGDLTGALAEYATASRLKPSDNAPIFNAGIALAGLRRFGEAEAAFRRALAIQPLPVIHKHLGIVLYRTGRVDEAFEHLSKALMMDPREPEAHRIAGLILHEKGDFAAAADHYRAALAARPGSPGVEDLLGRAIRGLPPGEP